LPRFGFHFSKWEFPPWKFIFDNVSKGFPKIFFLCSGSMDYDNKKCRSWVKIVQNCWKIFSCGVKNCILNQKRRLFYKKFPKMGSKNENCCRGGQSCMGIALYWNSPNEMLGANCQHKLTSEVLHMTRFELLVMFESTEWWKYIRFKMAQMYHLLCRKVHTINL